MRYPAGDAYSHLGLRHNPFIVSPSPGVEDDLFLRRAVTVPPEPGQRQIVQIIGDKGAGKTSLLKAWQKINPGPYLHIPPQWTRWRPPPVAAIAYWDEVDRLPKVMLQLRLRSAARIDATLVFGTHHDLEAELCGYGFAVVTCELPAIRAEEIKAWARLHIKKAGGGRELALPDALFEDLARKYPHDWRAIGDQLHIWVARYVRRLDEKHF